ncbi:MAG: DNA-protecting protein DprA [Promethearchaeota archaeon]|nr:MAG: DNA-protecting protein DprA [Candidatus Lokiarchaeota archaeon]
MGIHMSINVSNLYLILFHQVKGIGIKKLKEIYKKFGDFQKAYNAPLEDFEKIIKEKKVITNVQKFLNQKEDVVKKVKQINILLKNREVRYVSYFDNDYPKPLLEIEDPPVGLYIKGDYLFEYLEKSVSIIGTRDPSFYGHSKARTIARELAEQGYTIVSGLARGIDMEAHLGALEGGGNTIAVLGSGVENIYPEEHKNLAKDILDNGGALISELDVNQRSSPHSLVSRNRIVSGLSKASLIIEGTLKSGTRHEANFARTQNKYLFALRPLSLSREISELPLDLIENGAIGIETTSDIIDFINSSIIRDESKKKTKKDLMDFIRIE